MEKDKEISVRIKQARIASGYRSARIFAKEFGIAESTYAQHESGKRKISLATLLDYCKLLGTNPAWVITGREPMLTYDLVNKTKEQPNYMAVYTPILLAIVKDLLEKVPSYKIDGEEHLSKIVTTIYKDIKALEFDLSAIDKVADKIYKELKVNKLHTNIA